VTPRFALAGLLSLAALGIWPEWLPNLGDLPHWGQEWELADLEQSLDVHPPVEVERWLYNPRERTALGLERLHAEGAEGIDSGEAADRALAAFEAAARLAPKDRRVLFNTGTARLLADHGDAVAALEAVVAPPAGTAPHPATVPVLPPLPPEELQRAWYNLGAARLARGDAAGAVDGYEEALRLDPSDTDTKHNLEVALRRLEEERRRLLPPRESPGGKRPGEEDESDESGGTEPEERSGEDEERGGRDPEGGDRDAENRPEEGPVFGRRSLEGFDDQADLTAAQAAALLEAVENLERRERRIEAAREAARAGAEEEEDW
jgi:tetratricopeptide (TPR) repeat protein